MKNLKKTYKTLVIMNVYSTTTTLTLTVIMIVVTVSMELMNAQKSVKIIVLTALIVSVENILMKILKILSVTLLIR